MNKKTTKMLMLLGLMILLALPIMAYAQQGRGGQGRGGQGRAMQGMERLPDLLNLNEKQTALYQTMKTAVVAHRKQQQEQRQSGRVAFNQEMTKANPNFAAVAQDLKAKKRASLESFNAMVDAKAAFLSSLTPEQLKIHAQYQSQRGQRGQRGGGQRGGGQRGGGGGW